VDKSAKRMAGELRRKGSIFFLVSFAGVFSSHQFLFASSATAPLWFYLADFLKPVRHPRASFSHSQMS
jgi:hypothetical protein